ncbi:MAG: hypothetical protein GKR99_03910 [Rhodobacteraceae bacterium]|nr:hypothetical protein [Paracoccaceae bacterium]
MIWQGCVRSVSPLMTGTVACSADCVEKLRNQSVADFLRKPMKRNSRKALTTRQRMAARERM